MHLSLISAYAAACWLLRTRLLPNPWCTSGARQGHTVNPTGHNHGAHAPAQPGVARLRTPSSKPTNPETHKLQSQAWPHPGPCRCAPASRSAARGCTAAPLGPPSAQYSPTPQGCQHNTLSFLRTGPAPTRAPPASRGLPPARGGSASHSALGLISKPYTLIPKAMLGRMTVPDCYALLRLCPKAHSQLGGVLGLCCSEECMPDLRAALRLTACMQCCTKAALSLQACWV